MITILSQPAEIAFSRNPLVYELKSDARVAVAGSPFIAKLRFTSPNDVLFRFTLQWGGREPKRFTATVGPDTDGYEIRTGYNLPVAQFYQNAAEDLRSNRYLKDEYKIEAQQDGAGWFILFTSIKREAVYNIAVIESPAVSLQIMQLASDEILNKNFKLFLQLHIESFDRQGFVKVFETYLEPDNEGKATYDAGAAVSAELVKKYDRPNLNLPIAQKDLNSVRRYYLSVAEVYGAKQIVRKITNTDIRTAFYGGITKELLAEFLFPGFFIRGNLVKFLKQEEEEKTINPETPEYLTWAALLQDEVQVTLKTKIYFADGTNISLPGTTFVGVKKYDKYTWPVGLTQNNWHLIKDQVAILKYEVVVVNAAQTEISEKKVYWVDYTFNKYARFFNYLSSWGTYDTLVTYGKGSQEYDLNHETAEITQVGAYKLADGDAIDFESSMAQTESVTTGFRETRRDIRQFRDLFLSTDRFLLRKGRAYPIEVNSKSIKEFQDGNNLLSLSFEIGNRYKERVWTFDDKDDKPGYLLFPIIVGGGGGAGGTNLPENYFDYRYYRKTETYNKSEVDEMLNILTSDFIALRNAYMADINALIVQLNDKALLNHNHDDRYVLQADFDQFGIFPMTITNDLPEYQEQNGDVVITIQPELVGMSGYPVRNTSTNLLFPPDKLVYYEDDGILIILDFELEDGQTIVIG